MKKLQRKISVGLSKVNSEDKEVSAEINPVQNGSEKLSNETGEMTQRSDAYEGESGKEKKPTVQEHQRSRTGGRDKGVQRSKTVAYHSHTASPARVLRRKHSHKVQGQPTKNCTICYGDFTQPKQLPCLHTFCKNCLEKFVNPKLMVECPTCRKVVLDI